MENWFIFGDQSEFNEPTIVEDTIGNPNRPVTFEYRKDGSTEWTTDKPETPGSYYVRAQVGAYNEYLPETTSERYFVFTEYSINMSFDGLKEDPPTIKQGETVNVRTYVEPQTTDYPSPTFRFYGTMSFVADDRDESFATSKYDSNTEFAYMATLPTDLEPGIRTITANYSVDLEGKTYTMSAQKNINVLKNISAGFTCSSTEGYYVGTQNPVPDESAKMEITWNPDLAEQFPLDFNKCEINITTNYATVGPEPYEPKSDELAYTENQIIFTPHSTGIYEMTISYQDETYFASFKSGFFIVQARPLELHFKDMTIEKGNSLVPEYEIVEGSLAAGDEIKLDNIRFIDSSDTPVASTDASTLDIGDYHFTAEVSIYNAQGDDVSNQYSVKKTYENDAAYNAAALTVEKPRISIAVSYDEASLSLQTIQMQLCNKNMSNRKTTWTPLLIGDTEWVRSQSEGDIHFVAKDELSRYVDYDDEIGDNYTVAWYDEQGNQLTAIPTDAGTYTMKIALTGTAADQYALRYMVNGTTTADTLTFTIPKLDLSDNSPQYTQYYMRVTTTPGVYAPSVDTVPPASLLVSFPVLGNGSSYAHEAFELVNGRDYLITYNDEMNHTELGDAYLTIVGIGNVTGEYQVKYTIKPPMLYTVTIPASVTLPDNGPESAAALPITCTLQGPGLEVSVDVKSANDFTLGSDPDRCVMYTLENDDAATIDRLNGEVARFVASSTPLEELTITDDLTVKILKFYPLPEGEYTDTLTFTVHAEEKTESTN